MLSLLADRIVKPASRMRRGARGEGREGGALWQIKIPDYSRAERPRRQADVGNRQDLMTYSQTINSPSRAIGPYSGADLRFLSPQPDTSLHCQMIDTRLVHRMVCLFTSQLSVVLIAPTHRGMARLSWPSWVNQTNKLCNCCTTAIPAMALANRLSIRVP